MFLDLDDFKDINDTLGHDAGDQLLVAVSSRLVAVLREGDTVGRLGGDEFVLLVEGDSLSAGAEVVSDRILEVSQTPFKIAASVLRFRYPRALASPQATDLHLKSYCVMPTSPSTGQRPPGSAAALSLRPPCRLQPKTAVTWRLTCTTRSARTSSSSFTNQRSIFRQMPLRVSRRCCGGGTHRGVVLPDEFIPALEASGLIVPVGAWVLDEACRQGAIWHTRGHRFTVSVNVSRNQLRGTRLLTTSTTLSPPAASIPPA